MEEKDIFNEDNQVKSNWIKWGKIGDKAWGTLISVRDRKSDFEGKGMVKNYELKIDGGSFHYFEKVNGRIETEEQATILEAGSFWNFSGNEGLEAGMKNIKLGQKVALKFMEEIPSKKKGYSPAKIVRVYALKDSAGKIVMDEEWLKEEEANKFEPLS